jgi:beta-N-acetylhexosaminidase
MPRLADLSLEDRVGQLFWIGFEGTVCGPPLERLIRHVRPGGLILFGRNIETAKQVRALTDALYRALPVPPFIALDQEGGRVNRLRPIIGQTPSSQWLAGLPHGAAAVKKHATATVISLKSLGFNVNFAPVLDLSGPDSRNGIGDRAFAEDPRKVVDLASVALREHLRSGVIPVGKHFPGLGSAPADSHLALPVIRRSRTLLFSRDLLPYRRLRRSLPIIMVGHAFYPALQGRRPQPATLSGRLIDGILRTRIGHRGLVLTDDLEMGAIDQEALGSEQALAAFEAGNDGLMFCRSAERILEARDGMIEATHAGSIPSGRLNLSLRRILVLKERYLLRRRRSRFSRGSIARARLLLESLDGPQPAGSDPTARP